MNRHKPKVKIDLNDKFTDVELAKEYWHLEVPEHEVLMRFNRDDDAISFAEWWQVEGAAIFKRWLVDNDMGEAEQ